MSEPAKVRIGRGRLPALELADAIEDYAAARVRRDRTFGVMPWVARACELRKMAAVGQMGTARLPAVPLLTCAEYATRVQVAFGRQVSPRSVRRWAAEGRIEGALQLSSGVWLVPADAEPPSREVPARRG